jgi:formylglycine-generating enzyme
LTVRLRWWLFGSVAVLLGLGWAVLQHKPAATVAFATPARQCAPLPATTGKFAGMVWVPGGKLAMGDTVYPEEQPVQSAQITGFWMDRTEVSNAQFAAFVQATGYVTVAERALNPVQHPGLPPDMLVPGAVVFINPAHLTQGGDPRQWWQYVAGAQWRHPFGPQSGAVAEQPVVAITLEDAQAYAHWRGVALPTEAEWEWAARGGTPDNARAQPTEANTWQGMFPVRNQAQDGYEGLAPVGCYQPNPYGLYDMIGNAWELTATPYTDHPSAGDNLPPDQPPEARRAIKAAPRYVIKGGSYLCAPNYCMRYRAGARQAQEVDLATSHVGFRTVSRQPGP